MKVKRKVNFYSAVIPATTGNGAAIRVYTNLRAYIDLGYTVELILFLKDTDKSIVFDEFSSNLTIKIVKRWINGPTLYEKLSYIFGFPKQPLLNYLFPVRKIVLAEILKRLAKNSSQIHHFEYVDIASSFVGVNGNFIWSNHDLNPERYLFIQEIRGLLKEKASNFSRMFKYYQLKRSENWIAKQSKIMLNISKTETHTYINRVESVNSKLLPFSWPNEKFQRKKNWRETGKLKMLHLGSLNSMVPFSSLDFIINKLFRIIPDNIINQIELIVAGNNPNAPFSNYINKIARTYNNIKILGYIDDLDRLFYETDIQIVGSQFSSGIRTRIVESFVRGLPVLSTKSAAQGLYGLKNGENILLGKSEVEMFDIIKKILIDKMILKKISENANNLYFERYSRIIHSKSLDEYISEHIE